MAELKRAIWHAASCVPAMMQAGDKALDTVCNKEFIE
jgi:hypothetical protein